MIDDLSSLEQSVEDMSLLSDKELSEMKSRYASSAQKNKSIDLHAYKASKQGLDERSALQKATDSVKIFFGFTPERELDRMIDRLSAQLGVYTHHVGLLDERVSGQTLELKKVGEENISYRGHFLTVTEQYQRQRAQADRLEAELEQLGDSLTPASQGLRERLMSSQTEVRVLTHEANEAMQNYVSSSRRYAAIVSKHKQTSAQLSEFKRQQVHIGMVLDDMRLKQEIGVDGQTPSLMTQYEELGLIAQDATRLYDQHFSRKTASGIDTTYGAPTEETNDPLVEKWLRMRE